MSELNGTICRHCGMDCGSIAGLKLHEPGCEIKKKQEEEKKKKN